MKRYYQFDKDGFVTGSFDRPQTGMDLELLEETDPKVIYRAVLANKREQAEREIMDKMIMEEAKNPGASQAVKDEAARIQSR